MRLKTLALAAIATACLTSARSGLAETRADELQIGVVEAQTSSSPPKITVQWSQPASSTNFVEYQVMRGLLIPMKDVSLPGLAALVAGLFLAGFGVRTRRRAVAGAGLALGLALPLGFQALAFVDFQVVSHITDFGTTTYTDTDLVAGDGFFYKVVAQFDGSMQSSPPVYGTATDPTSLTDSDLVVRFEQGPDPNAFTPADGAILDPNQPQASVSACVAATTAGCGGVAGRGAVTGNLFLNQVQAGGDQTGSFTQPLTLAQGPNFVHLTGANGDGKTITVARTISLAQARQSGTLIPKAIGVVVSPKPITGQSLIDKLKTQINAQTTADWNDLLGRLMYPRSVHIQNSSATLDLTITNARLATGGDIVVNALGLGLQSSNKAIFFADLNLQNLNLDYSVLEAAFTLGAFAGNTCPRQGGPGRIHFGNVRVRATFTLSLESNTLFVSLTQLNGGAVIQDVAGDFDTQRLIGGPLCGPGAQDLDAQLLTALSDQAATVFNHIELGSASINDVPLGTSGLKLDLAIAELSQDPNSTGLVIRFDAGVQTSGSQVTFPLTNNAPPDSRTVGGVFPGAFTSALDAGFSLADDLINESVAAAQSTGLLSGAIDTRLVTSPTTSVSLTVAGLDPSPYSASALLPNLHLHAPPEAAVRIAVSYTSTPVVGLRTGSARAQGGLRLLQTGLVADVLVDTDRNGIFDPATEKALTLDLDVLSTSDVTLDENGALHFSATTPVRGYTETAGFLSVPHASLKPLADAIIDDRIVRLVTVLNGVGGAGLVIPGLSFQTLDSVADGPTAASYKDTLTAWGATNIDLKTLLQALLDRINPPTP